MRNLEKTRLTLAGVLPHDPESSFPPSGIRFPDSNGGLSQHVGHGITTASSTRSPARREVKPDPEDYVDHGSRRPSDFYWRLLRVETRQRLL